MAQALCDAPKSWAIGVTTQNWAEPKRTARYQVRHPTLGMFIRASLHVRQSALRMNQPPRNSLDRCLDPRRSAELRPSVVKVKVDGPLCEVQYYCDFCRRFAPRHPGQRLNFTIAHVHQLRPYPVAGDARKAGTDDGLQQIKIDRLNHEVVGTQLPGFELDVTIRYGS